MSQKQRILVHLRRHRTITPIQALDKYGCFRLGARIYELKESGHKIATEYVKKGNKRFAKCRLVA